MTEHLHLITAGLGSKSWQRAAARLSRQARSTGWFETITNYDALLLDRHVPEFRQSNQQLLVQGSRGFGYWLWRPYILRKALLEADEGSTILFLDAGCELNVNSASASRLDFYLAHARQFGICVMRTPHALPDWCKRDTLELFQISPDSLVRTIEPGVIFLSPSASNVKLMDEWIAYARLENFHHLDDSPSDLPNSHNFREHRHDQAILTCLLASRPEVALEQETYFGPEGWAKAGREFPIWVARNRSPLLQLTGPQGSKLAYRAYRYLRRYLGRMRRRMLVS